MSTDHGSHVVSPSLVGRPEQSSADISNVDLPADCALAAPQMSATQPDQRTTIKQQLASGGRHGHLQVFPSASKIDTSPSEISVVKPDAAATGGVVDTNTDEHRISIAMHANSIAMLQGLLHKRVYWYGDFYSDLWFWTKQRHVVLGIFLCHQLHPYSRRERFAVWLCCGCASFALGLLLLKSTGEKRGLAPLLSILNGCILAVLHISLKILATCPCVQEGSGAHCCQWYCEECGIIVMACTSCCILILLGACIMVAMWVGVPMNCAFQLWAKGQLVAFALGLIMCFVTFCLQWYGLRGVLAHVFPGQGGPEGARPKSAFPFGATTPSDPQIFPGGDRCGCGVKEREME